MENKTELSNVIFWARSILQVEWGDLGVVTGNEQYPLMKKKIKKKKKELEKSEQSANMEKHLIHHPIKSIDLLYTMNEH